MEDFVLEAITYGSFSIDKTQCSKKAKDLIQNPCLARMPLKLVNGTIEKS